jgi:hypothetical protein
MASRLIPRGLPRAIRSVPMSYGVLIVQPTLGHPSGLPPLTRTQITNSRDRCSFGHRSLVTSCIAPDAEATIWPQLGRIPRHVATFGTDAATTSNRGDGLLGNVALSRPACSCDGYGPNDGNHPQYQGDATLSSSAPMASWFGLSKLPSRCRSIDYKVG